MTAPKHLPKAEAAALNNARWCDAVCQAHGGSTTLGDALWTNTPMSPMFHPNLITLRAGASVDVGDAMSRLAPVLDGRWGVKDSFADLDLRPFGFAPLFDASWMWRDAPAATAWAGELRWSFAAAPRDLVDWEHAWEPLLGDPASARDDGPRFPPALLGEADIAFVSGRRSGEVVAGGVLNIGPDVVGLGNVFATPADLAECWSGLVGMAAARFPGRPLCTYCRTGTLEPAAASGFDVVGPLRVWLRT